MPQGCVIKIAQPDTSLCPGSLLEYGLSASAHNASAFCRSTNDIVAGHNRKMGALVYGSATYNNINSAILFQGQRRVCYYNKSRKNDYEFVYLYDLD